MNQPSVFRETFPLSRERMESLAFIEHRILWFMIIQGLQHLICVIAAKQYLLPINLKPYNYPGNPLLFISLQYYLLHRCKLCLKNNGAFSKLIKFIFKDPLFWWLPNSSCFLAVVCFWRFDGEILTLWLKCEYLIRSWIIQLIVNSFFCPPCARRPR